MSTSAWTQVLHHLIRQGPHWAWVMFAGIGFLKGLMPYEAFLLMGGVGIGAKGVETILGKRSGEETRK